VTDASDERLDEIDQAILDQLRVVQTQSDPPPPDLDARVQFAIALEQVDFEVARLADDLLVGSGARSAERTRTLTFDSDSLTIMISLADAPDGQVRLDGWLAPAGPLRVELRIGNPAQPPRASSHDTTAQETTAHETTADEAGRFFFEAVRHGLAQLLVHRAAAPTADQTASVVTLSFML
jgi:hypothetical protein